MNHETILRIDDLERLWPVVKDKLKYYDEMMDGLKLSQDAIKSLDIKLTNQKDYITAKIDAEKNILQNKISSLQTSVDLLLGKVINLESIFLKLENAHTAKEIEMSVFKEHLFNISMILKSCCKHDEMAKIQDTMQLLNSKSINDFYKLNKVVIEFMADDKIEKASLKDSLLDLVKKNDNKFVEQIKLEHDLHGLQEMLKQQILNQDASLLNFSNTLVSMIDSKINAIPKPHIPSLDDAKLSMQQQLEPVALDAKNANIRSSNTDTKLHVLEKKIEQVKLILDKFTLGE